MTEYAPGEEYDEEEIKNGEKISPAMMQTAQPLIEMFGEPVIRKIFSRTWTLREEGISEIEEQIISGRNPGKPEIFMGAVNLVKITIVDKIIGVCQRAIQFLITICTTIPNVKLNTS